MTRRRRALSAITLAALLGGATACGRATAGSAGASPPSTSAAAVTAPSSTTTTAADVTPGPGTLLPVPSMPRPRPIGVGAADTTSTAPPVEVDIPAIGVATSLEDLHLLSDGTIAAPVDYAKAGWFADGVLPGAPGPAIIAGHVDSHEDGPEVFYRLRELRPDDVVIVTRADGTEARFRITNVEQYPKDDFPVGLVYGPTPGPALRLVTCGGQFDRRAGHYRSNTVAFAVVTD